MTLTQTLIGLLDPSSAGTRQGWGEGEAHVGSGSELDIGLGLGLLRLLKEGSELDTGLGLGLLRLLKEGKCRCFTQPHANLLSPHALSPHVHTLCLPSLVRSFALLTLTLTLTLTITLTLTLTLLFSPGVTLLTRAFPPEP